MRYGITVFKPDGYDGGTVLWGGPGTTILVARGHLMVDGELVYELTPEVEVSISIEQEEMIAYETVFYSSHTAIDRMRLNGIDICARHHVYGGKRDYWLFEWNLEQAVARQMLGDIEGEVYASPYNEEVYWIEVDTEHDAVELGYRLLKWEASL